MSSLRKRVEPRQLYGVGPTGRKRLDRAGGVTQVFNGTASHGHEAVKPVRLKQTATSYLLVAAHSQRGALDAHAHQAIAAAALLAGPEQAVVVMVLGTLEDDLAPFGADFIAVFPELEDTHWQPDLALAHLLDFVQHYAPKHIILPDDERGDGDLGRRLAVMLEADVATHVVELKQGEVAMYWQGGARVARRSMPRVVLIAPDIVETSLPFRGLAEMMETHVITLPPGPYQDLGVHETPAAQMALEEADFILAAGNGVENVDVFKQVAAGFGAAVAASRVAVDAGKFARDKQVGATGKTVNASLYMAIGISGAIQHLQGIKACRHVIAVNQDASAPIVKRANLTIVGDAGEIMEGLLAELKRSQSPQETHK